MSSTRVDVTVEAVRAAITEAPVVDLPRLLGALVEAEEVVRLRLRAVLATHDVCGTTQAGATSAPDENLSAEKAARRLGLSTDYLYRNKLPFKVRIGRRVLFWAKGLERWVRQRYEQD